MKKRVLFCVWVLCLALTLISGVASADNSRGAAWAQARADEGWDDDYDGAYGVQCVDLIKAYYDFLGESPVSGNADAYRYNDLPSGWERIESYSDFVPEPGDIVIWSAGTSIGSDTGHVAIALSASDSIVTVAETRNNYVYSNYACHEWEYSISGIWGVIRPYDDSQPIGIPIDAEHFPDEYFRLYVTTFDTDVNNYLSDSEIAAATNLTYIDDGSIQSLQGIEYFTAMQEYDIRFTAITSLDLSNNTALEMIHGSHNEQLSEVTLGNLPNLANCHFPHSPIYDLDIRGCSSLVDAIVNGTKYKIEFDDYDAYSYQSDTGDLIVHASTHIVTGQWAAISKYVDEDGNDLLPEETHQYNVYHYVDIGEADEEDTWLRDNIIAPQIEGYSPKQVIFSTSQGDQRITSADTEETIGAVAYWGIKNGEPRWNLAVQRYYSGVIKSASDYPVSGELTITYVYERTGQSVPDGIAIDETNFPAPIFRQYVADNFDSDNNGYLNETEISAVDQIVCVEKEITSLKGIEFFTDVIYLNCRNCQIEQLDVSKNTKLAALYCQNNRISELVIGDNAALTVVLCQNNALTELDISGLPEIGGLYCEGNNLENLDISNNPYLAESYLTGIQLSKGTYSIYYITDETRWHFSSAEGYINPLSIDNTVEISAGENTPEGIAIDEINFPNPIFRAYVAENFDTGEPTGYLSTEEIAAIRRINCSNLGITSLKGIEHFTSLMDLFCLNNNLTMIDVSANTNLVSLSCDGNMLTALDVSANTNLLYLRCSRNQLTEIDLSNNSRLENLNIEENQLTVLDISKNPAVVACISELERSEDDNSYYYGALFSYDKDVTLITGETADDVSFPDYRLIVEPDSLICPVGETITMTVQTKGTGLTYRWQCWNPDDTVSSFDWTKYYLTLRSEPELDGLRYNCVLCDQSGTQVETQLKTITPVYKHIVQQGEILVNITASYGLDYYSCKDAIIILNNMEDESALAKIPVGKELLLPVSNEAAARIVEAAAADTVNFHSIYYDGNGGSMSLQRQAKIEGEDLTLTIIKPRRAGHLFLGWSTNANATEAEYLPGGLFTRDEDTVLYAVWIAPDAKMPDALTSIDESAFEGSNFNFVLLSKNTESIGKYAFASCQNLRYICFPWQYMTIDEAAFSGVQALTVIGAANEYEDYATNHGFGYIDIYNSDLWCENDAEIDDGLTGEEYLDYLEITISDPATTPSELYTAKLELANYYASLGDYTAAEQTMTAIDTSNFSGDDYYRYYSVLSHIYEESGDTDKYNEAVALRDQYAL